MYYIKISFVIVTARQNYPYIGRPDLKIFEPIIESLKNQTMKDFELIIVDALYDERKEYFKDIKLPFKVKHLSSYPNIWHDKGLPGLCTQYNKGIIYSDGELIFFSGESYLFIPEFCERLWNYYKEGYIPLVWYFYDNTFSQSTVSTKKIAYPIESELPYNILYNILGYSGKTVSIEHRPIVALKNNNSVYNATWEWWFGCSAASNQSMLKINGFDQRFDGNKSLFDCDVGSRLELAGYNKFGMFKDLFMIRVPTDINESCIKFPKDVPKIKCNYPLIYWSREFNHFIANDHENIDEDIKWCKSYCTNKCQIREYCKIENRHKYPFEHKNLKCSERDWFDYWRTHQEKINLSEERIKRLNNDIKYKEGAFT